MPRPNKDSSAAKIAPLTSLSRATRRALLRSLPAPFGPDPILGAEVSPLVSYASSIQKRHGHLLELAIVSALRHSGRYIVLHGVDVPVTAAAQSLVSTSTPGSLATIALPHEPPFTRSVKVDLLVIDRETSWAGMFEVKRGRGKTTQRLLNSILTDLGCAALLLRAFLAGKGFDRIESTAVALIDVYGNSRAPENLVLTLNELDAFFEVPVAAIVETMNQELSRGFRAALPRMLAPLRGMIVTDERRRPEGSPETRTNWNARTPVRDAGPGPSARRLVERREAGSPTGPGERVTR